MDGKGYHRRMTTPLPNSPEAKYWGLLFGVRRSVRYHQRRRDFYERFHGFVLLVAAVGGIATIAALGSERTALQWLAPAIVTLLALLDLFAGSLRKAWLHADLARRFIALERELVAQQAEPTAAALLEIERERLAIEADEPPIRRVLDTLCHNELWRAMGYPESEVAPVSFLQRVFAHYFDFRFDAAGRSGQKAEA